MPETISIEDHQFLINTGLLTRRALELDVLWTLSAGMQLNYEDRYALLATATEMQQLLVELARRTDRVRNITHSFIPDWDAIAEFEMPPVGAVSEHDAQTGQQLSVSELYGQASSLIGKLPDHIPDELEALSDKITRLSQGHQLEVADFSFGTRRILLALALVTTVVVGLAAPHVAVPVGTEAWHFLKSGWRVAFIVCAAHAFAREMWEAWRKEDAPRKPTTSRPAEKPPRRRS